MDGPMVQRPMRLFFLYTLLRLSFVQGQCYFPGGALAREHRPCNPHAFTSLCCQDGWTCLDNGLCIVTDPTTNFVTPSVGSSARGACTNPQWNSSACGSFCLDDPVNNNDGTVLSCGNHKWCCQPSAAAKTCDCGTGDGTFSVQAGVAHTIIGVTGLAFTSTDAIPISSASASSSTSSLAATATSSLSSSFSSTLPASSQSTSSPTTITATPSSGTGDLVGSASSTNSARPMGATYSSAFVAGMAVISAAVAAAITALIFYLVQRRRRQRAMRGDHIPTAIGTSNTNMQPPTSENLLQDDPGEYDRPFPTHNAGTNPGSRANRSRHSFGMVPDHDQGPPEQVSLLHPPALDPYARPPQDPNGLQEGLPMQGVPSATAPPSYRSNPRGSLRPRGNSYRALPRVPVPRRPDIAEDGQNGFSDGYR